MRLVLLHALPLDGRMWEAQMSIVPEDTLAPDLYGLGNSVRDWAIGVLEEADDDELLVVGCSVGGSAPWRSRRRRRIGSQPSSWSRPRLPTGRSPTSETRPSGCSVPRAWPAPGRGTGARSSRRRHRRTRWSEPADWHSRQDLNDVVRGVEAFHGRRDLTDFVRGWVKPLVVIGGDHGRPARPSRDAALAAGARHGEFHLVPGCGHYVNLEKPEAFERILGSVIERWWDG